MKKTVILVSGGIDSTTLTYYLKDKGHDLYPICFYYGQKHNKEILIAEQIFYTLNLPFKLVDIKKVGRLLKSSLTDKDGKIPKGKYDKKVMKSTVVPNRNMILLSIAAGYGKSIGATKLAFAAHGGDHFIYPDCRPGFVHALQMAFSASFGYEKPRLELIAPFITFDKTDIVRIGHMLKVPFKSTWSCYEGNQKHCGRCGTCYERAEAFQKAGISDPAKYEKTPVFKK